MSQLRILLRITMVGVLLATGSELKPVATISYPAESLPMDDQLIMCSLGLTGIPERAVVNSVFMTMDAQRRHVRPEFTVLNELYKDLRRDQMPPADRSLVVLQQVCAVFQKQINYQEQFFAEDKAQKMQFFSDHASKVIGTLRQRLRLLTRLINRIETGAYKRNDDREGVAPLDRRDVALLSHDDRQLYARSVALKRQIMVCLNEPASWKRDRQIVPFLFELMTMQYPNREQAQNALSQLDDTFEQDDKASYSLLTELLPPRCFVPSSRSVCTRWFSQIKQRLGE